MIKHFIQASLVYKYDSAVTCFEKCTALPANMQVQLYNVSLQNMTRKQLYSRSGAHHNLRFHQLINTHSLAGRRSSATHNTNSVRKVASRENHKHNANHHLDQN